MLIDLADKAYGDKSGESTMVDEGYFPRLYVTD